jgi:hypothetical protein
MANALHESGRNAFLSGTANWINGKGGAGAIQAALVTTTTFTTGIKQITGCTAATPPVVTSTAHGFANGDVVCISGVGGTLNANGIFVIAGVAANTYQLTDYVLGTNVVGTGTYTSGGVAVNLGPTVSTWAGYSANLVGTAVALSGNTEVQGTANASSATFTAVSGAVAAGIMLIATASPTSGTLTGTDIPIAWIDGQVIVTSAAQLTAGTTLAVERLPAPIPTATVLSFGDGTTATMTTLAAQFARTLTVSSTTVSPGTRATAPATGSGLPVTPNGGNISVTWDPNQYKIFKL